ncbi:MAG: hypothetical protein AB1599_09890, partial [Planctomycetota bacterium]
VHLPDETTAKALYGDNWAKKVIDVPDAFFTNYTVNSSKTITSSAYPQGSLIKLPSASDVYYIGTDGKARKVTNEAAFLANRFKWDFVITTASGFTLPELGDNIGGAESDLIDTSSGAGGVIGTGTGLSVALAASTPASATIPSSASNVPFASFNFTASSDGAVTISSLKFMRTGVGATTNFINMYLYEGETRLTNGRSVNSSSNQITFNGFNYSVPAGTTKTLTLVGDIDASITGNHAFSIQEANYVSTTATVSGSFPMTGNTMSISATNVGKVTVTKGSNPGNITAGSNDKELTSFTLAVSSTEDANIERVTLYHAGSVSNSEITNLELKTGGVTVATASEIPSNGLVTFEFATPYEITKGNSKKFYVYGDVSSSARAAQTVKFYMESNSDVRAIGQTYSYPLTVAIGTTDSANETGTGTYDGSTTDTKYTTTSIEAGDVTVTTNGPAATNVAANSDDVVLLNFSVTGKVDAEIRSMQLEIHAANFGDADLDVSDTTVSSNYITDIKITDIDTGEIVWGSVDISSFSDAGGATNDGVGYTFTNTVTLEGGVTRNFKVTADLSSSLTAGSTLTAVIGDEADANTFTASGVKATATNTYLTSIVPGTYTSGNQMTIQTASLTTSRATIVPLAQNVVRGTTGVEAASITFDASSSGADVKVTQIKLSGYVDSYSGTAALTKDSTAPSEGTLEVKDVVSAVYIYERASNGTLTQLGTAETYDTSGEATFDSLNWTIPKESSKILLVKFDIAAGISTILDYGEDDVVRVAADITDVSADIAAETLDKGVTVTPSGDDTPNNADAATGAQVTVRESGTIVAQDGTEPVSTMVVAGTSNVGFDQVRFTSTYEDLKITKLRVSKNAGTIGNLTSVTLTYKDQAGTTKTATQVFNGDNADFTGLDIYVKKDAYAYVDIGGNVKTTTDGATPGSNVSLIISGTSNFEAVGINNSSTKLTAISTNSATAGNSMYVVKTKPTFTTQSLDSTTLSSGVSQVIYKFSVTANAGSDVLLKQLPFQVNVSDADSGMYMHSFRLRRVESGSSSTNLNATLVNITGDGYATSSNNGVLNTVYGTLGYPWGDNSNSRTMAAIFDTTESHTGVTTGDSKGEETVGAGTTKTYELIATTGGTVSTGDSVSVYMPADSQTSFIQGDLFFDTDDPDNYLALTADNNDADWIWSDNSSGTSHSANWESSPSSDWYGGNFFAETSAVSRTK